jgi:hypothetical protein
LRLAVGLSPHFPPPPPLPFPVVDCMLDFINMVGIDLYPKAPRLAQDCLDKSDTLSRGVNAIARVSLICSQRGRVHWDMGGPTVDEGRDAWDLGVLHSCGGRQLHQGLVS